LKHVTRSNFLTKPHQVRYICVSLLQREAEVFGNIMPTITWRTWALSAFFTKQWTSKRLPEYQDSYSIANAACVILTHNHPKPQSRRQQTDIMSDEENKVALKPIDVRL